MKCEPVQQPAHLSPSSIGTWQQCPLRFKLSRIDKVPEPSTEAQVLGSFVHEILETLYGLPAEERTPASARKIAADLWYATWHKEVADLSLSEAQRHKLRWQVWWCVEELFKMENPTEVHLEGIEQKLEIHIGDAKLLGIIDRWNLNPEGKAIISDYKTGKKPRPQYEAEKRFQLGVYTHLIQEVANCEVSYAELLYLKEGIRWGFTPDQALVNQVISTVKDVWDQLGQSCSNGQFEAKPAKLCDWCNYKSTCPAWAK